MKKISLLFTWLFSLSFAFAQQPILTAIVDGDCTGGNPKVLEIYAHGSVDFSQYSIERQANGGAWGNATNLAELGTVTDAFVYVYSDTSDPEIFSQEFPSAQNVWENNIVNVNGDDGLRIIRDADQAVIDQFGATGVDGTGTGWEYMDGFAKRNNGTGPDTAFIEANWTYGNGLLDGHGICQGGENFESVMGGIGTYTPTGGSTEPQLSLIYPSNNAVLPIGTTNINVEFAVSNFVIGQPSSASDGHLHYTLNGGETQMHFSNEPFQISGLSAGEYTLILWLVDDNHQNLNPEVTASSVFTIIGDSNVSSIQELRGSAMNGSVYTLTSEAILTMQHSNRNQKWVQDATGGILIDDAAGIITTQYQRNDGITGISGTLSEFRGVIQLTPVADPGAPTSTGNYVEPILVDVAEFNANPNAYESKLIRIDYLNTDQTGTWETGTNYNFANNMQDIVIVRTNFYQADYIGTDLPTTYVDLIGIASEFNGTSQLYPRDSEDIIESLSVNDLNLRNMNVKVAVNNGKLHISGFDAHKITVYNINGQVVGNSDFVGNLKTGTYIALMQNAEGQMVSVKFIKK
ncbi:MAG: DUF5689 domain-containing protein [Flavobacteriaceae bacterium]|nr:DUF5689 domain-containing protein [Flavobacteriaceae bacterium]